MCDLKVHDLKEFLVKLERLKHQAQSPWRNTVAGLELRLMRVRKGAKEIHYNPTIRHTHTTVRILCANSNHHIMHGTHSEKNRKSK